MPTKVYNPGTNRDQGICVPGYNRSGPKFVGVFGKYLWSVFTSIQ